MTRHMPGERRDVVVQPVPSEARARSAKATVQRVRAVVDEALAVLSDSGRQIWYRQIGRPGTLYAEVVLPSCGGVATVRPWGCGLHELRVDSLRAIGVACVDSWERHQQIAAAQRKAARQEGAFAS
jgi:hypothetical protein